MRSSVDHEEKDQMHKTQAQAHSQMEQTPNGNHIKMQERVIKTRYIRLV